MIKVSTKYRVEYLPIYQVLRIASENKNVIKEFHINEINSTTTLYLNEESIIMMIKDTCSQKTIIILKECLDECKNLMIIADNDFENIFVKKSSRKILKE